MDLDSDDEEVPSDPGSEVALPPSLTVRELARKLGRKPWEINKVLVEMRLFMKPDSVMDYDTAARVCEQLGIVPRPEGGG